VKAEDAESGGSRYLPPARNSTAYFHDESGRGRPHLQSSAGHEIRLQIGRAAIARSGKSPSLEAAIGPAPLFFILLFFSNILCDFPL
jgi:hypothetical protein